MFWRPSTQDSIDSCLIFVEEVSDLKIRLEQMKTKYSKLNLYNTKNTCQPFIGVVNDKDFYIIFDNIFYKVNSMLNAIDTCFKLFYKY